ncbi:MAG: hypothetical protein WA632_07285, partial [Gallionella sp.]
MCKGNSKAHKIAHIMATGVMPLLSGCLANAPVPININDTNSSFYSARVQWHAPARPDDVQPPNADAGIEFQQTRTTGRGDQSLGVNEHMSVGGNSVTGPQQVSHRADIAYTHLIANGTYHWVTYPCDTDIFFGLGRVDFRLQSDVITASPLILQTSRASYG